MHTSTCAGVRQCIHACNHRHGDIYSEIVDLESAILADVTTLFLTVGPAMCSLSELCSDLDCLQSLALFARENEYVVHGG